MSKIFAIMILLVTPASSGAAMLEFVPSSQSVQIGDTVSIDIVISGLVDGRAPSVGAFDLDVSFDPLVLMPLNVNFGIFLGDAALFEVLNTSAFLPGIVDLAAVSLLSTSDLDALQPASFTLATLDFLASGLGSSPLLFAQSVVDDAFGDKIIATTAGGSVTVVPEPGYQPVIAAVLLTLAWIGRSAARRSSH